MPATEVPVWRACSNAAEGSTSPIASPPRRSSTPTISARVILINGDRLVNGDRLARLMIQYGVGVQTQHTYRLVEVDEDFFE